MNENVTGLQKSGISTQNTHAYVQKIALILLIAYDKDIL